MAVAELIVSRRALLGAACLPLVRHPGLDPGSHFPTRPPQKGRGIPDQVRNDERWQIAFARFRNAEATLAAVQGAPDPIFDRANMRFNAALARLLRTAAPDLPALATKLDLLVAHQVWELTFAPTCLAALRRDARRLASVRSS